METARRRWSCTTRSPTVPRARAADTTAVRSDSRRRLSGDKCCAGAAPRSGQAGFRDSIRTVRPHLAPQGWPRAPRLQVHAHREGTMRAAILVAALLAGACTMEVEPAEESADAGSELGELDSISSTACGCDDYWPAPTRDN